MKEYIEREAAMEAIKNHKCESKIVYSIEEALYCVGQEIGEAIRSVPAADVVEVVRCKDCDVPHNRWIGCRYLNGLIPPPDFYCAYGKSKIDKEE